MVATVPVMVPPLSPKLTPPELLKTMELRLLLVVPAEKLMLPEGALAAEIPMVLPFWDRVILLPPESTIVPLDTSVCAPAVLPLMLALILWRNLLLENHAGFHFGAVGICCNIHGKHGLLFAIFPAY